MRQYMRTFRLSDRAQSLDSDSFRSLVRFVHLFSCFTFHVKSFAFHGASTFRKFHKCLCSQTEAKFITLVLFFREAHLTETLHAVWEKLIDDFAV